MFGVIDKNGREVSLRAQSEEEKHSWVSALSRCINSVKEGYEVRRTSLFGADLKASFSCSCFYDFPSVIGACVEFLKRSVSSGCLLRHPGFLPLVRSFIQDFELKLDVMLVDTWSVAACLKMYLLMLPKPILSDLIAKSILDVLRAKPNDPGNAVQISKIVKSLDRENHVALNVILHYLSHEINRPEEVELTMNKVVNVWGPLLIRYKEETKNEEHKAVVLTALIRSLKMLYPSGPLVPVRKLPIGKLYHLKNDGDLTFENLRKDPYGMKVYARFVQDSFIDENLQFFHAVERYREMCESIKYTSDKRFQAGLEICKKFVAQGAEIQINVSASLSDTILARFDPNVKRMLTGNEFLEAETECDLLEATNSFPRFKKTEGFEEWVTHRYEEYQKHAAARPRKTILAPPPQASVGRKQPPPRPKHSYHHNNNTILDIEESSVSPSSSVSSSRFERPDPLSRGMSDDNSYRHSSARLESSYNNINSLLSTHIRSSDSLVSVSSAASTYRPRYHNQKERDSTSTEEPPSPRQRPTPPTPTRPIAADEIFGTYISIATTPRPIRALMQQPQTQSQQLTQAQHDDLTAAVTTITLATTTSSTQKQPPPLPLSRNSENNTPSLPIRTFSSDDSLTSCSNGSNRNSRPDQSPRSLFASDDIQLIKPTPPLRNAQKYDTFSNNSSNNNTPFNISILDSGNQQQKPLPPQRRRSSAHEELVFPSKPHSPARTYSSQLVDQALEKRSEKQQHEMHAEKQPEREDFSRAPLTPVVKIRRAVPPLPTTAVVEPKMLPNDVPTLKPVPPVRTKPT